MNPRKKGRAPSLKTQLKTDFLTSTSDILRAKDELISVAEIVGTSRCTSMRFLCELKMNV